LKAVEEDAFFAPATESEDSEAEFKFVEEKEKRPVMRDGRVPKTAKNWDKIEQKKIDK